MLKKITANSGTTLLEGVAGMAIISIASLILAGAITASIGFMQRAYSLDANLASAQETLEQRIDGGAADSSAIVSYGGGSASFDVLYESLTDDGGARLIYYRG